MALSEKTRYKSDTEKSCSEEKCWRIEDMENYKNDRQVQLLDDERKPLDSDTKLSSTKESNCATELEQKKLQNDNNHEIKPTTNDDYKSIVGSSPERVPNHMANYKTPHSQRRASQQQKKKQQEETFPSNGVDQFPIPEAIKKWPACVEVWLNMLYKQDIYYRVFKARQSSNSSLFMPRMRAILVDWIMEVCEVYQLRRNTYYLALDYIDRFLVLQPSVPKTQLQLLGVTCLYIASKLEEIYPPNLAEFTYVCDGACTELEIVRSELLILSTLDWNVNPMTPISWLNLFMQTQSMPHKIPPQLQQEETDDAILRDLYFPTYSAYNFVLACNIIDLFSLDPSYGRFCYSVIAASAMYFICGEEAVKAGSGLTKENIDLCLAHMSCFHQILDSVHDPQLLSVPGNGGGGACTTGVPHSTAFIPLDPTFSPVTHAMKTVENNQLASYRAIRAAIPNLVRDENHLMQTHFLDLDYYERAVVLRLEWLGFKVKKVYNKASESKASSCKICEGACNCTVVLDAQDQSRGEDETGDQGKVEETPPTAVMYEVERKPRKLVTKTASGTKVDAESADSTDSTENKAPVDEDVNIFKLVTSHMKCLSLDTLLFSVNRYIKDAKVLTLWREEKD